MYSALFYAIYHHYTAPIYHISAISLYLARQCQPNALGFMLIYLECYMIMHSFT